MTKNQAIAQMILANIANGVSIRDAVDAVCGAGTVERVAGEVYDELRERAA